MKSADLTIIFDLDGTLIDSSKGILAVVEQILIEVEITPACELSTDLIGPPLNEMLKIVTGSEDLILLKQLSAQFMSVYDSEGYCSTTRFEGVDQMLAGLHQAGYPLYIATNKRERPALRILDLFGWSDYFQQVHALDQFPEHSGKGALLKWMVTHHQLNNKKTLYIGDRNADHAAAQQAGMGYLMAQWGYGIEEGAQAYCLGNPNQLLQLSKECSQLLSIADRNTI